MKEIILFPHEGGIALCFPTGAVPLEQVVENDVPKGAPHVFTTEANLPKEAAFRNAWTADFSNVGATVAVTVDIEKAKGIFRDMVRMARDPQFEKMDREFMLALEKGEPTTAIVQRKQALRDAPSDPRIDKAKTLDELKATWSITLLGPSPF